jgi:hypothetical protein
VDQQLHRKAVRPWLESSVGSVGRQFVFEAWLSVIMKFVGFFDARERSILPLF